MPDAGPAGSSLDARLLWALLLFVPVSFAGARMAERIVHRIPQERFRGVVAAFLALVALKLLVLPSEGEPAQSSQDNPLRSERRQLEALLPKQSAPPGS